MENRPALSDTLVVATFFFEYVGMLLKTSSTVFFMKLIVSVYTGIRL